jgi:hypothetical protein
MRDITQAANIKPATVSSHAAPVKFAEGETAGFVSPLAPPLATVESASAGGWFQPDR